MWEPDILLSVNFQPDMAIIGVITEAFQTLPDRNFRATENSGVPQKANMEDIHLSHPFESGIPRSFAVSISRDQVPRLALVQRHTLILSWAAGCGRVYIKEWYCFCSPWRCCLDKAVTIDKVALIFVLLTLFRHPCLSFPHITLF
jgi:hypothetical protein